MSDTSTNAEQSESSSFPTPVVVHEIYLNLLRQKGPIPGRDETCVICLATIDELTDILVHGDCGNAFCSECLEEHIKHHVEGLGLRERPPTCPTCRGPFLRNPEVALSREEAEAEAQRLEDEEDEREEALGNLRNARRNPRYRDLFDTYICLNPDHPPLVTDTPRRWLRCPLLDICQSYDVPETHLDFDDPSRNPFTLHPTWRDHFEPSRAPLDLMNDERRRFLVEHLAVDQHLARLESIREVIHHHRDIFSPFLPKKTPGNDLLSLNCGQCRKNILQGKILATHDWYRSDTTLAQKKPHDTPTADIIGVTAARLAGALAGVLDQEVYRDDETLRRNIALLKVHSGMRRVLQQPGAGRALRYWQLRRFYRDRERESANPEGVLYRISFDLLRGSHREYIPFLASDLGLLQYVVDLGEQTKRNEETRLFILNDFRRFADQIPQEFHGTLEHTYRQKKDHRLETYVKDAIMFGLEKLNISLPFIFKGEEVWNLDEPGRWRFDDQL